MLPRLFALAALTVLAAACTIFDRPTPGSSIQTPPSQTKTEPVKTEQREWMKPDDYRAGGPVPALEPNRKINEQSCTEGINLSAGNLMCR